MQTVIEQRTPDWYALRVGKVTASKLSAVVDRKKDGKPYAEYSVYQVEKVIELLTGKPLPQISAPALDHGTYYEPFALALYQERASIEVLPAPFVIHPGLDFVGGSPDGLIGTDGLLEIKCPYNPVNHLETLIERKMPSKHYAQVQGNLWITGRAWLDFVSYHPDFPPQHQIFIQRQHRDDAYIATLEAPCVQFMGEVNQMIERLGDN